MTLEWIRQYAKAMKEITRRINECERRVAKKKLATSNSKKKMRSCCVEMKESERLKYQIC